MLCLKFSNAGLVSTPELWQNGQTITLGFFFMLYSISTLLTVEFIRYYILADILIIKNNIIIVYSQALICGGNRDIVNEK